MKMNNASAIKSAYEIAKIVCEHSNTNLYPDERLAKDIAKFVDVLSDELSDDASEK